MQQTLTLKLKPEEAADNSIILSYIKSALNVNYSDISGYSIIKKSMDARSRQIWIQLSLLVFINETPQPLHQPTEYHPIRSDAKRVVIIGAGPAGLFAALRLIELGIQPIILERGKDVRARRRDLAALNKQGEVNPESNYCFGEGGAGTYSDGKLYTRSSKRGNIHRILQRFVQFGAEEKIIYEAHPHIGTNKLPHIITAMRQQILDAGGEFIFEKKVTDFIIDKEQIQFVKTADGDTIEGNAFILATGHSARDIFVLLKEKKIKIEPKPFALGVRIEHPQSLIDSVQYHCDTRGDYLPPASYSLVQQVNGRGVFSFCMCPGGIIAPAATSPGELVVNGWSPSKRNNPYANSGMVVQIELADVAAIKSIPQDELSMMAFQRMVEVNAFSAGGGKMVAPAQRMVDFTKRNISTSLPDCSYLPGIHSADLTTVLPSFVYESLSEGFKAFGKKMRGYFTNDAVVVATESRTSSPVKVPRDYTSLQHPQILNLYPCGEGAGYAGGIVSAAMDGERVAEAIASVVK